MALKVGDKAYFLAHAYYHYLGEVTEILGVRRVALRNVVQVHSSSKSWTKFFAEGCGSETKYDVIGEAPDLGYIACFAWPHAIPKEKR